MLEGITINIISVVVVFFLTALLINPIKKLFDKWFLYKGINIEGNYICSYNNSDIVNYRINLVQLGKYIHGEIHVFLDENGKPVNYFRKLEGEIRGVCVLLKYEDKLSPDINCGFFILRINSDYGLLQGVVGGYYENDKDLYHRERIWKKSN